MRAWRRRDGDLGRPGAVRILCGDEYGILTPVAIAVPVRPAEADPLGEEEQSRHGRLRLEDTAGLIAPVLVRHPIAHGRDGGPALADVSRQRDGAEARDLHR